MIRFGELVYSPRGSRFSEFLRRWRCRALRWQVIETDMRAEVVLDMPDGMVRGNFSGKVCRHNLFARECPASLEGPREAWDLAQVVIDHGCCIFERLNSGRSELGLRDVVVQALFRRLLITAEAIRSLLAQGLEEPAFATCRTLHELERDLRLVITDPSDTAARRLAAFFAVKGRRHFAKAPKNPDTREFIQSNAAFFDWFRRKSRSFRDGLDSDTFRDLAQELKQADHWHGFPNQQEAFEAAGMAGTYHLEYGGSSLFVHGNNVEHDFADVDDTRIQLKPFAQRDPGQTLHHLGRMTLALINIYSLIWEDRGKPAYQEPVKLEDESGPTYDMDALVALTAQATSVFRAWRRPAST